MFNVLTLVKINVSDFNLITQNAMQTYQRATLMIIGADNVKQIRSTKFN